MRLLVLGVSHHTAPIDLRERLAFPAGDLAEAIGTLARHQAIGEVVLLSTCNRTEVYATTQSLEDGHEAMTSFLAAARDVPPDDLGITGTMNGVTFRYYAVADYRTLIGEHGFELENVYDDPGVSTYYFSRKRGR